MKARTGSVFEGKQHVYIDTEKHRTFVLGPFSWAAQSIADNFNKAVEEHDDAKWKEGQKQLKTLVKENDVLSARIRALEGTNVRLNHEIGDYKDAVRQRDESIACLQQRVKELESERNALKELAAGRYNCAERASERYYALRGKVAALLQDTGLIVREKWEER